MHLDPHRIEVMSPEMSELLRHKTPAEKLAMSFAMWKHAQTMLVNVLRTEHPEWDDVRIRREAASRMSHGTV